MKQVQKQLPDNAATKNLKSSAVATESTMKALLIGTFIMNFILSGAMIYMIAMIRTLQLILHLPLMKILFPVNINMLFSIMIPIVMFDIIDSSWSTELLFNFDEDAEEEKANLLRRQITDLGYDNHNAILNLGSVFIFLCFYLIEVFWYSLLKLYSLTKSRFHKSHKWVVKLKKKLFFGELFTLLLEAYLELVLSGYLNQLEPVFTSNGDIAGAVVGYTMLIVCGLGMPIIYVKMLQNPLEKFTQPNFERKWGSFYDRIRTDCKYKLCFYLIFMTRRVLFVVVAFWVVRPVFQI